MIAARGHEPWCGAAPGKQVCQCRANIACVDWLVAFLRLIMPIAAAAYLGRCHCKRTIPWERIGWANPMCYVCVPEDERDRKRAAHLRALVRSNR